jgi:hypothetical protein
LPQPYGGSLAIVPAGNNISVPFSYPASVFIQFYYTTFIYIDNSKYFVNYYSTCNGVLVNRKSILTSASCVIRSFKYSPSGHKNDTVLVTVDLNAAFPLLDSLYTIYVGVKNYVYVNTDVEPVQQVFLEEIIIVNNFNYI